jgi:hypothetical protein
MPETFDSIHNDDLGEVIGYIRRGDKPTDKNVASIFQEFTNVQAEQAGLVDGLPVRIYYPKSIEAREDAWRRHLIEQGKRNDRR